MVVALWLAGIVINLLTGHARNFYDNRSRDLGLFLAAVALNRLATALEINTIRPSFNQFVCDGWSPRSRSARNRARRHLVTCGGPARESGG